MLPLPRDGSTTDSFELPLGGGLRQEPESRRPSDEPSSRFSDAIKAKGIRDLDNTLAPFLADGPVFDPAKPDPVDYLTSQAPVSLRPSVPGKIPPPGIFPAVLFPDGMGTPHTADGKHFCPGSKSTIRITRVSFKK